MAREWVHGWEWAEELSSRIYMYEVGPYREAAAERGGVRRNRSLQRLSRREDT